MERKIIYQDTYLYFDHTQSILPDPKTAGIYISEGMGIYYNIKGKKRALIEGSSYSLASGELFIFRESEGYIVYEDKDEPSEYMQFIFSPYVFRHLDPDLSILSRFTEREYGESNLIHCDKQQNALIAACTEHILHLHDHAERRISFLGFLMMIINEINNSSNFRAPFDNNDDKKILNYINNNLAGDLTNRTLAQMFYISESYFCRRFRKLTGTNLTEYVNLKRVNCARNLLRNNVKIKDVLSLCGFSNYTTFYKCNMKYYNTAPGQNYTRKNHDPLLLNGLYQVG